MHELSIAYNLVELASEAARSVQATRVQAVHVRLGALSGVVADALLFGWEIATENTLLAGARLVVEALPVIVACPDCQTEVTLPGSYPLCCPRCGAVASHVVQGRELELQCMEIETEEREGHEDPIS